MPGKHPGLDPFFQALHFAAGFQNIIHFRAHRDTSGEECGGLFQHFAAPFPRLVKPLTDLFFCKKTSVCFLCTDRFILSVFCCSKLFFQPDIFPFQRPLPLFQFILLSAAKCNAFLQIIAGGRSTLQLADPVLKEAESAGCPFGRQAVASLFQAFLRRLIALHVTRIFCQIRDQGVHIICRFCQAVLLGREDSPQKRLPVQQEQFFSDFFCIVKTGKVRVRIPKVEFILSLTVTENTGYLIGSPPCLKNKLPAEDASLPGSAGTAGILQGQPAPGGDRLPLFPF